ncbi:MAG TPA: hypothetical protein VFC24_04595 [Casimicrobiaceae bacterium]|nr:hypothetical protein [Casimicrobiaceae bacterium]
MLIALALLAVAVAVAAGYAWGRRSAAAAPLAPAAALPARGVPVDTPGSIERAQIAHLAELAEERRRLFAAFADAQAETARYRDIVIGIEDNAPPPLLGGPGTPDDLKLIVGIGPVLERMLHQLGITTYRQIARWTERDIDEFDARLPEFPGRIRRDAWVTQARALHQSLHGEPL